MTEISETRAFLKAVRGALESFGVDVEAETGDTRHRVDFSVDGDQFSLISRPVPNGDRRSGFYEGLSFYKSQDAQDDKLVSHIVLREKEDYASLDELVHRIAENVQIEANDFAQAVKAEKWSMVNNDGAQISGQSASDLSF